MTLSPDALTKIDRVVEHLRESRSILFITGAGLSADSNLPTYRGIGGLYNDIETEDGILIEDVLSGSMIKRKPELTWKYMAQIEAACRGSGFNRGHEVIALFEKRFERVWVLTQNVDGFHRRAGSKNVIDIHGDIHVLICKSCGYTKNLKNYEGLDIPPHCPDCGNVLRPDVVLFGEMLPEDKTSLLQRVLWEGFQIVFSVGTSSLFPYIVQPVTEAKMWGVPTVEINPGITEISRMVDYKIAGRAAETLDAIWKRLLAD